MYTHVNAFVIVCGSGSKVRARKMQTTGGGGGILRSRCIALVRSAVCFRSKPSAHRDLTRAHAGAFFEAEAREARSPQAQIECTRTCELMSPGLVPIRAANSLVYLFGEMGCGGDRVVGV